MPVSSRVIDQMDLLQSSFGVQAVSIGHADPADDRADNSNESLVRSAEKEVGQMGGSVQLLVGCTVDGPVVMPGEASNRLGGEHVGVDHVAPEIGHESNSGRHRVVVLADLRRLVLLFRQSAPAIVIGERRDADHPSGKLAILRIVNVVVR